MGMTYRSEQESFTIGVATRIDVVNVFEKQCHRVQSTMLNGQIERRDVVLVCCVEIGLVSDQSTDDGCLAVHGGKVQRCPAWVEHGRGVDVDTPVKQLHNSVKVAIAGGINKVVGRHARPEMVRSETKRGERVDSKTPPQCKSVGLVSEGPDWEEEQEEERWPER